MLARGERTVREFGIDTCTPLYLKWITGKDLRQHRELCSILCAAWMGGGFGGEWIRACVWLSPSAVPLKLPQHCELAVLQYKMKRKK